MDFRQRITYEQKYIYSKLIEKKLYSRSKVIEKELYSYYDNDKLSKIVTENFSNQNKKITSEINFLKMGKLQKKSYINKNLTEKYLEYDQNGKIIEAKFHYYENYTWKSKSMLAAIKSGLWEVEEDEKYGYQLILDEKNKLKKLAEEKANQEAIRKKLRLEEEKENDRKKVIALEQILKDEYLDFDFILNSYASMKNEGRRFPYYKKSTIKIQAYSEKRKKYSDVIVYLFYRPNVEILSGLRDKIQIDGRYVHYNGGRIKENMK